jgi:integrase
VTRVRVKKKGVGMKGHIRKRGVSWEYIIDVGVAAAQRCQGCGQRFWVDRKPRSACPKCGGKLLETEERRRATQAGFASKKDCQSAMTKVIGAIDEQRFVLPVRLTLHEYLEKEWLPAIASTVRATTYRSYRGHIEFHIVPALGSVQLQRLNGAMFNAFYAKLAKEGRYHSETGLSPATIRRIHATLHRALRDAVRWNRLSVNPVDAADPPKASAEQRKLPAWSGQQLFAFLESVRVERLYGLWHFLAMTGCRRGEALGLQWCNIDLENARVTIDKALVEVGEEVQLSEPKSARGRRTIALDPETVGVLRAHHRFQAQERLRCGATWTDSGFVFTEDDGCSLTPWRISMAFQQLRRRAGLPQIPLHGLRHTYASVALSSGINPRIVSGRLGHSTVAFTLDVYSHVLPQADEEAAVRIAALVRPRG